MIARRIAEATVSAIVVIGSGVVFASPASADECRVARTHTSSSDGAFLTDGVTMYSGPSANCAELGTGSLEDDLVYRCFINGADGHTWTYLRNNTQGLLAWTNDGNLLNDGSSTYCTG